MAGMDVNALRMKVMKVVNVDMNMLIPISSIASSTLLSMSLLGSVREKAPVIMNASSNPIPALSENKKTRGYMSKLNGRTHEVINKIK